MADIKPPVNKAQAGLIVLALASPAEANEVSEWQALTAEVIEGLPLAPANAGTKKRKNAKGKAVTIRTMSEQPLMRAMSLVNGVYASFSYRIKRTTIFIRVYLHLDNGDVPADYVPSMRKIMWRTMRAWEVEQVTPLDMSNGVGPLIMLDKVGGRFCA